MKRTGLLFISYDGMLEPLGQSQVLAYQEKLARHHDIHIISFEKELGWSDEANRKAVAERMRAAGIIWHPRRYHKRISALATTYDVIIGIVSGLFVIYKYKPEVIHARSYVPSVMALALKYLTRRKFIFDMRGFWADERTDGEIWPKNGLLYRTAKWFERRFFVNADHIVALTEAAKTEIEKFDYLKNRSLDISIIPTCADLSKFSPGNAPAGEFVLGYVGSAGTWYLFDEVIAFYRALLKVRPNAKFLIVNRYDNSYIRERLKLAEVSEESFEIIQANHNEVPVIMRRMHAGIFFYKPTFSRLGCSPTKLGEFLGCGVPCVSNVGVGDMDGILRREQVGVSLPDFDRNSLEDGVRKMLMLVDEPTISKRCELTARKYFSLEQGVEKYNDIYQSLKPRLKILYVSYDGMLEPLGQSQVLAYQEKLAKNFEIHLISYEKHDDWVDRKKRTAISDRIAAAGIEWHPMRYHKSPSALATSYDVMHGILIGAYLVLSNRIDVIHARSYVTAVIALTLKKALNVKFIFDMRGFWADERIDGGIWEKDSILYSIAKWFEKKFLLNADHIVSLTKSGMKEMAKFSYLKEKCPTISVIPTCANLNHFILSNQKKEGFVFGYVGSAGTWYLFDVTVSCFAILLKLKPDAKILIINRNEHEYIRSCLIKGGIPLESVEIRAANHEEMPALIARMHASIFLIKPVFSKQASAPTKLGELLGCGVPCLSNWGVGDMAEILEGDGVGVALSDFTNAKLEEGLLRLIALTQEIDIAERCSASAKRNFSLDNGVLQYKNIYESLADVD